MTVTLRKAALKLLTQTCTSEMLTGCALHSLKDSFATQSFSFYTFRTYTRKHPLYKDVSHFRAVRKYKLLTSTPKSFLLPFCLCFSCNNTSEIISDGRGEKTFMWCSTTALSLCPLPAFLSLEQDLTDTFLMNTTPIRSTFERSTALVRARNISLPHLTSEKTHFHSLTATCRSVFSFCKYRISDLKQKNELL